MSIIRYCSERNSFPNSAKEVVSSVLPMLKEHIRLGHAGIIDHSV